jgi:putative phosphoribosyl transferase
MVIVPFQLFQTRQQKCLEGKDTNKLVELKIDGVTLHGNLQVPNSRIGQKKAFVIFAHGSGSSRLSPRNLFVAKVLQEKGIGTLLFDLLTEREDQNYETRFDIKLLSRRLEETTRWALGIPEVRTSSIGYFGASTGAAAALIATARLGRNSIKAVVSRGGRPDMAGPFLSKVVVPTLFIVGGSDEEVIELNKSALKYLGSDKKELVVVPRATHLFEEPGALEKVAEYATDWFWKYL